MDKLETALTKLGVSIGTIIFNMFAPRWWKLLIGYIGYYINGGSELWAIFDYCFASIVLFKWIWCHQITLVVIKSTFSWFFAS